MYNKNRFIALILARGNSKTIKKNLTNLWGKPLVYWSIKSCLKSKLISSTYVSSDDKKYYQKQKIWFKYNFEAKKICP